MTDRPAGRFGLTRRGRIERGHYADIVVLDETTVNDTATYRNPRRFPIGIPFVIVDGAGWSEHRAAALLALRARAASSLPAAA